MNWLDPWIPIPSIDRANAVAAELRREVSNGHILYGIPLKAVGLRKDCDDVLFELLDGTGRFAVAHLTYSQEPERDLNWPAVRVCNDWAQFAQDIMQVDHAFPHFD